MNFQAQCFRDVAGFREAVLPFLRQHPSHLNQLLAASERLTRERAEKNQTWLGCLREDGNVVAAAICTSVLPARHLSISDWPAVAMPQLIEALGDFPVDGVVGPFASAEACAHALGFRHLRIRLQNYALLEPPAKQTAPGYARLMERADIPWLADWFSAFEIECNLPRSRRPELIQQFEEDLVAGSPRRCGVWDVGGESVAMANMVCIGSVARLGPVYTPPDRRACGYAGALVAHLATEAFEQGATVVCLYADAGNPTSNALYQRLGFNRIGDFGHFERDGSP
jgi:hypothetical protein